MAVSPTVHLAFDECHYLEHACMFQMLAMASAGGDPGKMSLMPKETVDYGTEYYADADTLDKYAVKHFYAYWNKYAEEEPEVFQ